MSFIKSKLQTAINNNMRNTFKTLLFISLLCGVSGADERKSVMEGDSVTLQTDDNKILTYNKILWWFEGVAIAEITDGGKIEDITDVRFRGRLKLDHQTGSLTITNIRTIHSGDYKIEINTDTGTTEKKFTLTVYDSPPDIDPVRGEVKSVEVMEGEPVPLNTDIINPLGDELIVWRFGSILIAKVYKENNKISFSPDERFKGRIHLDQTGSLIINNSRTAHTGEYKLKISSSNRDTIYKRFILIVNHPPPPPLSAGAIAGITVAVLLVAAAAAVGVIYYRRKISEQERKKDEQRTVFILEGESVPLITDDDRIKKDDVNLYYGATLKAEIRRGKITHVTDDIRERLKLNHQTGSLIITDSRRTDAGIYQLKTINSTKEITYKTINVTVKNEGISEMVTEGNPVNLFSGVTELQEDAEVEWKFKNTVMADKKQKDKKISLRQNAHDGKFKQNLLVDQQTGSLSITDFTKDQSGDYELKIISSRVTVHKIFNVTVSGDEVILKRVKEGESVDLFSEIQKDAQVVWKFADTVIAEKKQKDKTISLRQDAHEDFGGKLNVNQQTGSLTITDITMDQGGVYELKIISSRANVHQKFNVCFYDEYILNPLTEGDSDTSGSVTPHGKAREYILNPVKEGDSVIDEYILNPLTEEDSDEYILNPLTEGDSDTSGSVTPHGKAREYIINPVKEGDSDIEQPADGVNKLDVFNIEADDGANESDSLMNNAAADEVNKKQVTSPV
ncbi:uncharacterized protein LOC127639741 isoform X5 [Xyrauchen texanus]|uniref:uncharacterized protein LOC127639741 isoform X3 n=1 Tax=Xyrauchen texanus TaxID=154827 RepID=UPI0022421680|nr:uncharacterized protein LOC127639741 isoform X3 [Xyrauchen texanus]XP_051977891.1 uncharacterized protein LOC127639741 isoform X4 [Xyrauchen texanus]XP_051977892.1 uncharacterized protein LOC127639741 isoform X5 [Xyrauchen texanus]